MLERMVVIIKLWGILAAILLVVSESSASVSSSCAVSANNIAPPALQKYLIVSAINPESSVAVPGALEVTVDHLDALTYPKSRPLLIVGDSLSDDLNRTRCEKLKAKGYNVAYLQGGIRAWVAAGYPLKHECEACIFTIDTADIADLAQFAIVYSNPKLKKELAHRKFKSFQYCGSEKKSVVQCIISQKIIEKDIKLVVFDHLDKKDINKLYAHYGKERVIKNVFVYQNGLQDFLAKIDTQAMFERVSSDIEPMPVCEG